MNTDVAALSDLMTREEALHEDLEDSLMKGPLGMMIQHPLVFSLTFMKGRCGLINAQYAQKKQMLEDALAEENYQRAIGLHERPYRVDALMEYINDYGFEENPGFWEAVGYVWTDSENIYQLQDEWNYIWACGAPDRRKVMSEEDQRAYDDLRDTFAVYRGVQHGGTKLGMSWSVSLEKAAWFAKRFQKNQGTIYQAIVNKKDVLAHFTGRNEGEIVIFPDKLNDVMTY